MNLQGQQVAYRLVRVRRHSIGMVIDHDGLTVRAPKWVTIAEIESALAEKARWIVRKLAEWGERTRHAPRQQWQHGAPFLFRGRHLELAVYPSRTRSVVADLFHVRVTVPETSAPEVLAGTVGKWLRDQTEAQVVPLVHQFAGRIAARVRDVRLTTARTQWGSCNRAGDIRLHYRLIQLPPHLADYVVAHEVAHLRELNHSPAFWSVVGQLYPDWAVARSQLHQFVPLLDG